MSTLLQASVFKLAMEGEQAGFTVDQMIRMLNAGGHGGGLAAPDRMAARVV